MYNRKLVAEKKKGGIKIIQKKAKKERKKDDKWEEKTNIQIVDLN